MGSLIPRFIPTILKELFVKPSFKEDESIYDFAARRFSPKMAEMLFDPLTLGIYAGDIRKLSIRSCFPAFYHWERETGSVIRGLFSSPKKEKGLFTIKEGMQTLIDELEKQLDIEIVLNCPVDSISAAEVFAGGKTWEADKIINALPPELPKKSIWVVNLAFEGDVLPKKGFGYLVPSLEKQPLLGMMFDSAIFPQQNRGGETRLTAMIRAEEKDPQQIALFALENHLHINAKPIYTSSFLAKEAIAQFEVGCSYPYGISVDACIQRAIKIFSMN